jgi:hypothetical protein
MRLAPRAVALLLPTAFLVAVVLVPQPAEAGTYVVFQENFEGDWPGPWLVGDDNLDAGADYWGVTGYRESQGKSSAWAAQEGKNSATGLPNAATHTEDVGMDAYLRVDIGSLSGVDALTLTFKYWIEAGPGDDFSVRVSDGVVWTTVWSLSGPVAQGWASAEAALPLSTSVLEFRYATAASHDDDYEGVYVDKVEVLAEDSTPPSLSVLEPSADAWLDSDDVLIGWSVSDLASGVAFVEVRLDGGAWINVGDASSFLFYDLSEGTHSVEIRAVDKAANVRVETVSFGVDMTSPSVVITGPQEGDTVTSSSFRVSWTGGDAVSGIAYYEVQVDDGPWVRVGTTESYDVPGVGDGLHVVRVKAVDLAGNSRESEVAFTVNTNPLHPDGPGKGALLYGLIGIGLVGTVFALHRREKIDLRSLWSRFRDLLGKIGLKRKGT